MEIQISNSAIERVWGEIEDRRDELAGLVANLVQMPSPLGSEAQAQAFVAEYLGDAGLATDVWELDESIKHLPEAGDSGVPFAGRPNVAGTLSGSGGGRSLIFNGHIDVVSPEPVEDWTYGPWEARIVGDRMYGRGALDMKSGLAINLFLPKVLRDAGIRLQGDLSVQSVIEEECTGNGALSACQRYRADAAVVTESENGRFTWTHLGVMWFKVSITGKSWHAMQADRGVNAIVKAMPIIRALQQLEEQLNERVHPAFAHIEHPIHLNVGVIRGGDWPSTVPGSCDLHCRVSFFPDQPVTEMRATIEETVQQAAQQDDWLRAHPPVVSYAEGFQSSGSIVEPDEPSVRLIEKWHGLVTGEPLQMRVGTSINDMRYFNFACIPAGCYGASGGNPHGADEWLDLNSLVPTAKVLSGFMLEWCGVDTT